MDIGHKIKQLRIQKGLTLEELASRSEVKKLAVLQHGGLCPEPHNC